MIFRALFILISVGVIACGDDGGGDTTPDAGFSTSARPGKRSDIAAAYDPTSKSFVVFGGDDGPIVNQIPSAAYLGDTWVLSASTGWTEITGGDSPSARGRYAVSYDPQSRIGYLFGGRWRQSGTTGNYTLYNDLWAFDFAIQSWSLANDGSGTAPAPRYFAAAAFDPDAAALVIWGGDTNPSALSVNVSDEVWAYSGGNWSQRSVTGTAPSARLWVAYTYDSSRNRLVVFGGQVGDFVTPSYNDTYALDLSSNTWTKLHDGSGTAPSGRFSSSMIYDATGDRYLVFGGHADAGVTNDVWAFNPNDNTWSLFRDGDTFTGAALGCLGNPREIPKNYVNEDLTAPERRSTPVTALIDDRLWLFGGESDCSDHLDDLWRLDLSTGEWDELVEARSGESCARRNDACECLCL